jgi:magnesium chelatase family protein
MLAKVESACLIGMEAARVHVEVNLSRGLPTFSIVGLPDTSVRESRDRVVAAIRNAGFEFPARRVTVNLAPADVKKEGACFDLAIAVGVLLASEAVTPARMPRCVWLGELALDGTIHPVRGVLSLVRSLAAQGRTEIALPAANTAEISFLEGITAHPVTQLTEVAAWLRGEIPDPVAPPGRDWHSTDPAGIDLAEIKGQAAGKRALEIAAAGGHNLLMVGCPGTGKSLLAQALPTVLPRWTLSEALDATQVHSICGRLHGNGLLASRPFRAPHPAISATALIGGGDYPMPGELSLAHRGTLFLDELPEFRRDAIEALRQPLEEGMVHIQRVRGRATYPADCQLIAAMNPCPCGYRGHPKRECVCTPSRVQKYIAKISGPFLDRIDLQIELPALRVEELFAEGASPEPSAAVRGRVEQARAIQAERYRDKPTIRINAALRGRELKAHCALEADGKNILKSAVDRLGLSARAFDRIRKVARTNADLAQARDIQAPHVAEAIQYRLLDRNPGNF